MLELLISVFSRMVGALPLSMARGLGVMLGSLFYLLDKRHRDVATTNLMASFPSMSEEEARGMAKKVFRNIAVTAIEAMRIEGLDKVGLEGYVEMRGKERLDKALSKGRGVIILTAHFGNWELLAATMALHGYPMDIVVRPLDNAGLEAFTRRMREAHGNRVVDKTKAMRRLIKTLSSGKIVGILIDQNVQTSEGVFVDFFKRPACTNKGPALLAASTGAAVLPTFIYRAGKGHILEFLPEAEVASTKDREADALKNTAAFTAIVEKMVREHVDEWFWVHRRWKTRPPGAKTNGPAS